MKNSIYLIALAVFFIFGCNESPNSSPSNRVNDPNFPTENDGPNSITDIPTPEYTDATVDDGTSSGYKICLTWTSNTPGYADGYSSYSTTPTDANNFDHDAEYWGNTQNSIVGPGSNGHENQPYSGHYEIYRDGVKIADVTGNSYCDDNLAAGTYVYTIKSKSLEGVQPNAMTHHSELSEGFEVSTCEEVEIDPIFEINPILGSGGGNGSWNEAATMWTANSSATNQNMNMFYNVRQINRTQNSCTGVITEVGEEAWTGDSYLSRDGGTTWRKSLPWEDDDAFHHNGNNPGGNGSGLGKFVTGCHTIYWTIDPDLGIMGSFILNMNSTCTP
jgi:hypothetical protein